MVNRDLYAVRPMGGCFCWTGVVACAFLISKLMVHGVYVLVLKVLDDQVDFVVVVLYQTSAIRRCRR